MKIDPCRGALLALISATTLLNAAPARVAQDLRELNAQLLVSIRGGDVSRITNLLRQGADPTAKDTDGTPALMLSAVYTDAAVMKALLDRGADPNATNAAQATALHWSGGDPAKVKMLVLKGADVKAVSAAGRTALAIAAGRDGSFETVKLLVEHGADLNAVDKLEGFIFTGGGEATPLIEAAKTRDLRTVQYLLDRGANVNAADHMGCTALTEAALRGSVEIAKLLIERGAEVNVKVKRFGTTPLMFAAMRGSAPMIDLLLSKGAEVEGRDGWGSTALMWAAYSETADTAPAARIIKAGANINVTNQLGETPKVWSYRRGETPVLAQLRIAGATSEAPAADSSHPAYAPVDPRTAVERSLAALDKGGPQFSKVSGCFSCHNQTLPLMASQMARRSHIEPNAGIEAKQLKSVLAFIKPRGDTRREHRHPARPAGDDALRPHGARRSELHAGRGHRGVGA